MALTLSTKLFEAGQSALEAEMYASGELQYWDEEDTDWWNAHHHNSNDKIQIPAVVHQVLTHQIGRQAGDRQREKTGGDKKNSGGKNSDDGAGEPPRPQQLLNQNTLAALLGISKKTLQNVFCRTPHLLPKTICIPGARGPRWTQTAVQAWLDARPAYTTATPAQAPTHRKVGRPRIALAVKGGAK